MAKKKKRREADFTTEEMAYLSDCKSEQTFMNRYNYAKSIGDTNFMRDYAKNDRYVSKQNYRRLMARIKKLKLNSPYSPSLIK